MILNIPKQWHTEKAQASFDSFMQLTGEVYRAQPGRKTQRINLEGNDCFIKQHTGVGYLEIIKNLCCLRMPIIGARNEWRALKKCQQAGIATANLVAYGERGMNPATQQSFVMTKALGETQDLQTICQTWQQQPPTWAYKKQIITQLAIITQRLHAAGMNHRDLYLCHFFLDKTQTQQVKLYLMDLHRVQIRKKVPQRWLVKDLSSLLFSCLDNGFSQKDLFYFLRIYTGGHAKTLLRSPLFTKVLKKTRFLYHKAYGRMPEALEIMGQPNLLDFKILPLGPLPTARQLRLANGDELQVHSVLRHLPHKRCVIKGLWRGQAVVAKLFAQPHKYQKELKGVARLHGAGISAPACLYQAQQSDFAIIIYAWLAGSEPLSQADLPALIHVVAQHHQKGLVQKDIHINNFLKTSAEIYTLDAADIIKLPTKSQTKARLSNLACLFAQFYQLTDEQVTAYLKSYAALLACPLTEKQMQYFMRRVKHYKQIRKNRFMRKIFRHCSRVSRWHNFHETILLRNDAYSQALCFCVHHVKQAFRDPQAVFLKKGNSSTVIKITLAGEDYVIKRYNTKSFWHGFKKLWRPTRARRSWYNAHLCEFLGIPTAQPVAMIENHIGWLNTTSYFIMRAVPGITLQAYLKSPKSSQSDHQQQLRQLACLLKQLMQASLVHGDLKASNFILNQATVALVDLDSLRLSDSPQQQQKDLQRFLANFSDVPEDIIALQGFITDGL